MGNLRWQWTLANRGVVTASIDPVGMRELVAQEGQTLSESTRGGRPEGHTIAVQPTQAEGRSERPPIEAVVSFDPSLPICILRVDGQEVPPTAWPIKDRTVKAPPPPRPWAVFGGLGAVLLLALFLFVRRLNAPPAPPPHDRSLAGTTRALNGLFIAHYPPTLEAKPAVLPATTSGILLEDKEQKLSVIITATAPDPAAPHDPWALQQKLREEILANVPKGIARFEETARRDETCLGEKGAAVVGHLAYRTSIRARVWSCAFVHNGAGYMILSSLALPADPELEATARKIVDSTELTHLSDLGLPPDPSALKAPTGPSE